MTPRAPALHEGASLVTFGSGQPQYSPLPASMSEDGMVMPMAVEITEPRS